MADHEQVLIKPDGWFVFEVDKGIEDIILNLFHWNFYTNNSCIDNFGKIWIDFDEFRSVETIYQMALTDHLKYYEEKNFDTLYTFLEDNCETNLLFIDEIIKDPNQENTVTSTGRIDHSVSIRFNKELLPKFRQLFFEVFPAESYSLKSFQQNKVCKLSSQ
jgi:hypothetical protein